MLIVVSHSSFVPEEAQLLNKLFEEGLALFHFRKPDYDQEEYEQVLSKVHPFYRKRIALHQHHSLAEKYGIHRLHFPSHKRIQLKEKHTQIDVQTQVYSTSIHQVEEYGTLSPSFSYAFLSPVFDSISKPSYLSRDHDLKKIDVNREVQIIGIGGINPLNYKEVVEKGYNGIALCGAIWHSDNPVNEFLKMKKLWNTAAPSY